MVIGWARGTTNSAKYSEFKTLQVELPGASPENICGFVRDMTAYVLCGDGPGEAVDLRGFPGRG